MGRNSEGYGCHLPPLSERTHLGGWRQENLGLLPCLAQEDVGDVGVGLELLHEVRHLVVAASAFPHPLQPVVILAAVGIYHHPSVSQGSELLPLQVAATASGEPQHRGVAAGTDECRLLALHDANRLVGMAWQEMQAEEHLFRLCQLRPLVRPLADGAHGASPSRHPVAVLPVRHQLGVVHPSQLVYQPEHHGRSVVHATHNDILRSASHIVVLQHLPDSFHAERLCQRSLLSQMLQPKAEGARPQHRLLCPRDVEELGLVPWLGLGDGSPGIGSGSLHGGFAKNTSILPPVVGPQLGVVAEELPWRKVIAARCRMVALAALFAHILARLRVNIPGEASLLATGWADEAIAAASLVTFQNVSIVIVVFHLYHFCIE